MLRTALVSGAIAIGVGFAALPSQGAAATSCSTKNIAVPSGYRIVRVQAVGLTCTKARSVARTVASQLHRRGGVDIPGVAGFAMSTETCTGCGSTTQISLSYPSGAKVTVALKNLGGGTLTPSPAPSPTPLPLPSPGPGPLTV